MDLPYIKHFDEKPRICHICGATNEDVPIYPATPRGGPAPFVTEQPVCGGCFREVAEKGGQKLHDPVQDLDSWVDQQLVITGLGRVERAADPKKIHPTVLKAIPVEIINALLSGHLPRTGGIGLGGLPGAGKSCGVAALIHGLIYQNARSKNPFVELKPVTKIRWMSWTDTCHRWRLKPLDDMVARDIERARRAQLLVLDDLGREVWRREASEDVAIGHLDAIVTHRDREGLFTLWTTNLTEEELISRYGMSMVRRLIRLNPLVFLDEATFHPEAL